MDIKSLIQECIAEVLVEGTRECSVCYKPLGTWDGEGVSHGICPECKIKMRAQMLTMKSTNGGRIISKPTASPNGP